MISGFVLVDKDPGWTSHDVVARLRRSYGQRRVGHAGTLDPMATGVLIVGLGNATRLLRLIQGLPKTYTATILIGAGTVTDDAEGEVVSRPGWRLNRDELHVAMRSLTGSIDQVPSAVSAVKVRGVRSYARVRAGEHVELSSRRVAVARFDLLGDPRSVGSMVEVEVLVECSAGTYVRALARDLGKELGSAAHLTALCRTHIGPFALAECSRLGEREQAPPVASIESVLGRLVPTVPASDDEVRGLRNGVPPSHGVGDGIQLIVDRYGDWVSVLEVSQGRSRIVVNAPVPSAGR